MHFLPPGARPVGAFRGPPAKPRRSSRPSSRVSRARVYQRRMTQEKQMSAAAAAAVAAEAGKDADVSDGETEEAAARRGPAFDLDDGGAIYWIGQQVARRTYSDKDFVNPGVAGAVRVARSSGTAGVRAAVVWVACRGRDRRRRSGLLLTCPCDVYGVNSRGTALYVPVAEHP